MDIITYALCKRYIQESLAGAGALKGDKGDPGKSAYDLAKAAGFSGTQTEWLSSLKGKPGEAPQIGDNGNWWVEGIDTGIPAKGVSNYEELENLPDIPEKLSQLINDCGFITLDDIPKNLSDFENDVGYLISSDLKDFLNKDEIKALIPTKVSELENDSGFLTEHQELKTINNQSLIGTGNINIDTCQVQDVLVNGVSIVEDKVAKLNIDLNAATMGRDFITNIDVGHLKSGTPINATDTLADILYRILYAEEPGAFNLYFGSSDNIPTEISDLDWYGELLNVDIDKLPNNQMIRNIKSGNVATEEGQYPTLITTKAARLVKLTRWNVVGGESLDINFITVEKDNYYIYYIGTKNYNEDEGGIDYVFTFAEVK